jgi:hypothetical protein
VQCHTSHRWKTAARFALHAGFTSASAAPPAVRARKGCAGDADALRVRTAENRIRHDNLPLQFAAGSAGRIGGNRWVETNLLHSDIGRRTDFG